MMRASPEGMLEHVGVVVRDLWAARRLFHETLRLPLAEYPSRGSGVAFAVKAGGTVIRVASEDSPEAQMGRKGVHHVAFKVPSVMQTAARLERAGIAVRSQSQADGQANVVWTDPATTVGIPLQFIENSPELSFVPAGEAPFIERVDHLGIACRDSERAKAVYMGALGWPLECTQTDSEFLIPIEITSNDKYGATSHTRAPIPRVGAGLIALFITVGDLDLEIMQPLSAATIATPLGTIPGSVGQDQGAIARALESRGEGLLHICFKTADIKQAIAHVTHSGIRMIDPTSRPGARGSQIAFMDRRTTEGIPASLRRAHAHGLNQRRVSPRAQGWPCSNSIPSIGR